MRLVLTTVIVFILCYIVFSFNVGTINPLNWERMDRELYTLISTLVSGFIYVFFTRDYK